QLSRDARAVRIEGMRTALRCAPSRSRAGDSTGGKGAGPAGGSRAGMLFQPVGKVATMATSARERILTAAKTLAESHDSVQGVTISLESVRSEERRVGKEFKCRRIRKYLRRSYVVETSN